MTIASRRQIIAAFAAAAICWSPRSEAADEPINQGWLFLMIEEPGCPYCAKWKREVEQSYRNSPEGRFAPLEIITQADARARALQRIVYSPTFVLTDRGREIGRIVGYSGPDFFWGELEMVFKRAGMPSK